MRLPRVRFTVRRIMAVVGLVAMTLGVGGECHRRAERFRGAAQFHRSRRDAMLSGANSYYSGHELSRPRFWHADGKEFTVREEDRLLWHGRLEGKYLRAARRPWLPVEPDPPTDPRRRGCSCGDWETRPRGYQSLGYPFGYCGRCEECGRPGHTRRPPGAWPSTGARCDYHYRLLRWADVRSPLGCLVWLSILGAVPLLWWASQEGDRPSAPHLRASAACAGGAAVYGVSLAAMGFVLAAGGQGVHAFLWVGLSGLILWPVAGAAVAHAHRGAGKGVFLSVMSLQYLHTCLIASEDGEGASPGRLSAVGGWLAITCVVTYFAGQAVAWWVFASRARRDG